MNINEQTAQLILDAIAWCNEEWTSASGDHWSNSEKIAVAREDFINFCNDRGISSVEVTR